MKIDLYHTHVHLHGDEQVHDVILNIYNTCMLVRELYTRHVNDTYSDDILLGLRSPPRHKKMSTRLSWNHT